MAPADLGELQAKYVEIRRLRSTPLDAAEAKLAMRALAARFPGALRELDALPMAEIDERLRALGRALADPGATLPWMPAMTLFHRLVREALASPERRAGPAGRRWMDAVLDDLARTLGVTATEARRLVLPPRGTRP